MRVKAILKHATSTLKVKIRQTSKSLPRLSHKWHSTQETNNKTVIAPIDSNMSIATSIAILPQTLHLCKAMNLKSLPTAMDIRKMLVGITMQSFLLITLQVALNVRSVLILFLNK